MEVLMYTFLALRLMVKDPNPLPFPGKKLCALYRKLGKPMARIYRYGEEKNFLPLTVFIPQTNQPAESIGTIREEF